MTPAGHVRLHARQSSLGRDLMASPRADAPHGRDASWLRSLLTDCHLLGDACESIARGIPH